MIRAAQRWLSAPWAQWVFVAVAGFVGWLNRTQLATDFLLFARSGDALWSGHLSAVYAESYIQAGPLQLSLGAAVHTLARVRPGLDTEVLNVVGSALMALLLLRVCAAVRRGAGLPPAPALNLLFAALALLWGWIGNGDALGHPAEFVIPAMWVWAALALRRQRPWLAGLLIGASTGWEIWGLLGIPLLLLAADRRQVIKAIAAMSAVLAVFWVPFLAAGHFEMLHFEWPVRSGTPVSWVLGGGRFTSGMRTLQLTVSLAGACAVALLLRRRAEAVWLVPLTAIVLRLWLDPMQSGYYWLPCALLAMAAASSIRRLSWVSAVSMAVLVYVQFLALWNARHVDVLIVSTVLLVSLVVRARRDAADLVPDDVSALTALTALTLPRYVDSVDGRRHDEHSQAPGADRRPRPQRAGDHAASPAGAGRGAALPGT